MNPKVISQPVWTAYECASLTDQVESFLTFSEGDQLTIQTDDYNDAGSYQFEILAKATAGSLAG